jgi:hypothetical protein
MAQWTVRTQSQLDPTLVLSPERYDPRRYFLKSNESQTQTALLGDVVTIVRKVFSPSTSDSEPCLVLDTSDASEGVVVTRKQVVGPAEIGSAKKCAEARDVIISRLRPYLRQVAFIDHEIVSRTGCKNLLCSTEFFVLRSRSEKSIAFLVPFLLSEPVQQVLAVAQEGGHHPRFREQTLTTLLLPKALLERRDPISDTVEASISFFRQAEQQIAAMAEFAGSAVVSGRPAGTVPDERLQNQ